MASAWAAMFVALTACGRVGFSELARGTGDGGRPGGDVQGSDGDRDSAPPGCSPGAVFCDDFESGDLAKWAGTDTIDGSTIAVAGDPVHAGSFALLGTTQGVSLGDYADAHVTFASPSTGSTSARAFLFKVGSSAEDSSALELSNTGLGGSLSVHLDPDTNWEVTEAPAAGASQTLTTTVPFTAIWVCIEVGYDAEGGMIELFIDDTLAASAPAVEVESYDAISLPVLHSSDAGTSIAVDDVVVAGAHIGCN